MNGGGGGGSPSSTTRAGWLGRALGMVRPVLIDKVERDHWQTDSEFKRRRIVVAITLGGKKRK